jgi:hypothetical protein
MMAMTTSNSINVKAFSALANRRHPVIFLTIRFLRASDQLVRRANRLRCLLCL